MTLIDSSRPGRAAPAVPIAVYGNRWCGISQMIRRSLERAGVDYAYVDLDLHPDAQRKLEYLAGGDLHTPVVYIDGEWLQEPSLRDVQRVLARHGVWI